MIRRLRHVISPRAVRAYTLQSTRTYPDEILKLTEYVQREKLRANLRGQSYNSNQRKSLAELTDNYNSIGFTPEHTRLLLDSVMGTFLLHVEARIASARGKGFYTIGPCGEEILSSIGLCFKDKDASALHYRHVGAEVTRQLQSGASFEEVALDRARGYTCSTKDPVTGGKHCAIGGHDFSYVVTSTLASQAPPAVGRALAIPLMKRMRLESKFASDSLSFVTVGDGSINNAHFLSAINMAEYAQHTKRKCPVVFGISDNGICISLKGHNWVDKFVSKSLLKQFYADSGDIADVYRKTAEAFEYSRSLSRPSIVLYKHIHRRFGHAATDRQNAYLTASEIEAAANNDNITPFIHSAIECGHVTPQYVASRFDELQDIIERAFDAAALEPKITDRAALVRSNSQPLDNGYSSKSLAESSGKKRALDMTEVFSHVAGTGGAIAPKKVTATCDVMRKHMNRVFDEALVANKNMMYIGEDVQHGGYYLVTDTLAHKHPGRVVDFPPDETALVGAAMGFSQVGLLTVLEIPYAKYLDCAADMFNELVLLNWLSNGRQPCGMVVRLQGFDKGIFGGNFHTHNMLQIPPGLDVVCFSNGRDYVKGMRYALRQAKAGRVVMSVDCTDLLNRRHLDASGLKESLFLTEYPVDSAEEMSFDEVSVYKHTISEGTGRNVVIVTYGNGVPTALQTAISVIQDANKSKDGKIGSITVVDSPYLSSAPGQLKELLATLGPNDRVLFADICKEGPGMPFGGISASLQNEGLLTVPFRAIGAEATYNPLGNTLTFLSVADIRSAINKLVDL